MIQLKLADRFVALCLLCAASTVSAHAAALALNTDFGNGSPTYPTPAGSTVGSPDTFSVSDRNVFYLGGIANDPANPCFIAGSSSATCLAMPVEQGVTALLTSTRTFESGTYTVELQLAGGASNARVLAELGSPDMINVPANSPFTAYQITRSVAAGVITPFTITANNEVLLGSVRISRLTGESPVPEPASWALMLTSGLGMCGLGIYRRRRVPPATSAPRSR